MCKDNYNGKSGLQKGSNLVEWKVSYKNNNYR